jgi:hypothetical protein
LNICNRTTLFCHCLRYVINGGRNDCENGVDAKFILLAKYVDRITDGDETTILNEQKTFFKQRAILY